MPSPSMSNTHSSRPGPEPGGRSALDEIVTARSGRDWCLFLDRDGVINRQIIGDYVRSWRDFEWLPDVRSGLKLLRAWAPHLVIVTNQQGIGKGMMSLDDVGTIHRRLQSTLMDDDIRIDAFMVCPHLESSSCACRKPRPGMVFEWLRTHPTVDPSLSIVVGDSRTDIELAHAVADAAGGCAGILIGARDDHAVAADANFASLRDFAAEVQRTRGA